MTPIYLLRRSIWPAFAFSVLAAIYIATREDDEAMTTTPTAHRPDSNTAVWLNSDTAPASEAGTSDLVVEPAPKVVDIFAVKTWEPPPPPPPKPAPPPPPPSPQAPPLPFKLLGRIVEAGRGDAFLLAIDERVLSVAIGDVIDERYLLEKFESGQLHFLYRPLNIHQTLSVGPTS